MKIGGIKLSLFVAVFLLGTASISCSRREFFENPFDANTPLSPPTDFAVKTITEDSLVLEWTNNIHVVGGAQASQAYVLVQESEDGKNFSLFDSVSASKSEAVIVKPFLTNQRYYFRIRTRVGSRFTDYTGTDTASVPFEGPSDLQIASLAPTSVELTWKDNSSFETKFVIEMSTDGLNFDSLAYVGPNRTSANIHGAWDSTTIYYFRVNAETSINISPVSNTVNRDVLGDYVTPDGFEMIFVKGGTFEMGSPDGVGGPNEHPQHEVQLSSFYIGKYEVTNRLWTEVETWESQRGGSTLQANPSWFPQDSLPVNFISWSDADTWISYLNQKEGTNNYALPTEAQWEFAALGGTRSKGYVFSGSNDSNEVAVTAVNSNGSPYVVGLLKPNELGIYDMSGNVCEWCYDWYGPYTSQFQVNPTGPTSGTIRVLRGGSWGVYPVRVKERYIPSDDGAVFDRGFRIVKNP